MDAARSVLEVRLQPDAPRGSGLTWRRRVLQPADEALARVARWGGTALALAWLEERARVEGAAGKPRARLLLTAGDAVRRGLPTAARASVLGRAPHDGSLVEGQVGGGLGDALTGLADLVVLEGRTDLPGAVLVLGPQGARVEEHPELVGCAPRETWRRLGEPAGVVGLVLGPAGEQALPFATLATGAKRPSFVGRGGLGAQFGRLGLKALLVEEVSPRTAAPRRGAGAARRLVGALMDSPRLAARAEGGTLELFEAYGVRGELAREDAGRLAAEARALRREREGCPRCPTPCGLVFERPGGERQGARFGAGNALSLVLGLTRFQDALALLADCDALGVDAKEVGVMLDLLVRGRECGVLPAGPVRGDAASLRVALATALGEDAPSAESSRWRDAFRAGAATLARALGLAHELTLVRGTPVRPSPNLAALLGQCVSTGGTDPMRSFPFLVGERGLADLERLAPELAPLPPGAADPAHPAGTGRLVAWHEDLVTAVDATGFCAFSTAGLIADEALSLDALAEAILPDALVGDIPGAWGEASPGERLLGLGANLVLLRRVLDERALEPTASAPDRPAWAAPRLDLPGVLDEYRAVRGLDERGRLRASERARLGEPNVGRLYATLRASAAPVATAPAPSRTPVVRGEARVWPRTAAPVRFRASGPLAEGLGPAPELRLPAPRPLRDVLTELAREHPGAARHLLHEGRPLAAAWRAGRPLAPEDYVRPGDVLDLVVAIAGG